MWPGPGYPVNQDPFRPPGGQPIGISGVYAKARKYLAANTLGEREPPHVKDSSKARYAVRALVDLAGQPGRDPITLAAISGRQGISVSYLEQLFRRLRAGGLVNSVRGPGGGFVLTRSAHEITIAAVFCAVRDTDEGVRVPVRKPSERQGVRPQVEALWQTMEREFDSYLQSVTIQDVLSGNFRGRAKVRLPAA